MQNQNNIQIFENKEFGQIRIIEIDGAPWFIAKDIAEKLAYKNGSRDVKRHVDEEDMRQEMIPQYRNGTLLTKALIINESGLYSLILSAKLPSAKAFKRWVTAEVLPAIRKHGAYATAETLSAMQEDPVFTAELLDTLGKIHSNNQVLIEYVGKLQPKAYLYDTILQSPKALPVSVIAKDYSMTTVAFNRLLHKMGIQYKIGGTWLLYKKHTNLGYTLSKTCKEATVQTGWTMKGRLFLYNILKEYGYYPDAEKGVA